MSGVDGIWMMGGLSVVLAAAAMVSSIAAVLLLRDNMRLERANQTASDEAERLRDELWRVADSEERHRGLVEAQGDLILRQTVSGRVLYANQAYKDVFGSTFIRHRDDAPQVRTSRLSETREDGTRLIDEQIELADGSTRWIAWVETGVRAEDGEPAFQRVGRDITQRIRIEDDLRDASARAEEASEAKSRFLATVSHEFRTPLNGILGMADLLGDTALEAEQRSYVQALKASGEALLNQVEEILDFARVETGRIDLLNEPFDLPRLVEDVVELIAPRAQEKGLDIAAAIAPSAPARRVGDAEKLRQILINLVGNAVKFTGAGHVSVALQADDETVRITVRDSGPGIAAHRLEAIFLEFEQASAEVGRLHGGTGLGLPIARRLARAMGGDVCVESREGAGAAFHVALPLPALTDLNAEPLGLWEGEAILLVGAGQALASAITVRAEALGGSCRVTTVAGAAAEIAQGGLTAIVIDHGVGPELARALAELAARHKVPRRLIALTPFDRRAFGAPAEAGFTGFLVKPARSRTLDVRLGKAPGRQPEPMLAGATPARAETCRARALIAEDNDINALILQRHIEKAGGEAVRVRDGREALALLESVLAGDVQPFDIAFFDVRMPNLDGLEATRLFRAAESGRSPAPMPIVAVSANVAEADRRAALAAGMNDCLGKPLDRERLLGWLAEAGKGVQQARSA